MTHALAGLPESHSNIVEAVEDWGSYSSTRRLWSAVYGKVPECTKQSADLNSSSTVPGLWPHTARRSTHLLHEFSWEVFKHPPYIPDFAHSKFNIIYASRNSCSVFRMTEAEMSVTVIPITGCKLLQHRKEKLVPRYNKCLNSDGKYVGK